MSKKAASLIAAGIILLLGISIVGLVINRTRGLEQIKKVPVSASQASAIGNSGEKTQTAATKDPIKNNNIRHYQNKDFGLSFDYANDGILAERHLDAENLNEIELYFDQKSRIFITYEISPPTNNPKDWFDANRHRYNDLIVENGETDIQGSPVLFLGIPNTCRSVPVIVAIISHRDRMYIFTYFESASRTHAEELKQILESLAFEGQIGTPVSIPDDYLKFPGPPANTACP